jgi:uncharacterized phage protein (TIGR01671 family)
MREIKFRAWFPENHWWLENHERMLYDFQDTIACEIFSFNDEDEGIIFMQYTGLKDKNGKEIYEGDIINVDNSEPEENGEYDQVTICKYEIAGFTLEDSSGGHWSRQLYHQPYRLTVIGNIYENPELCE